jgi:general secretion pathway protein D
LNKIEQRIRDAQGEKAQKQFEVETKFLQFSDNDVKNLTFNLSVAMYQNNLSPETGLYSPGSPGAVYSPNATGGTDGLRGTAGLNQNGVSVVALQNLLDPTYPQAASNQVGVNAQVLGRGFSAFVQLLQNAIGKDLVAAPRVTLADGKPSEIIISRQMFYPTSYTQPTVPNNDQGVGAGFILPSTPTGFESRKIGVTLTVKGESTSIPKAVDLDFTKLEVQDFEGFVDYGVLIAAAPLDPIGTTYTTQIGTAPYLVPIFSRRSLKSRVRLLDGETVGLGGLISESVQQVNDKVPGLGDMPIVGRLFRSEASQKIRYNLVVFCTVRIIEPDGSLSFPEDNNNPEYAQAGSAEMMPSVP